jgi:hypothetical protein
MLMWSCQWKPGQGSHGQEWWCAGLSWGCLWLKGSFTIEHRSGISSMWAGRLQEDQGLVVLKRPKAAEEWLCWERPWGWPVLGKQPSRLSEGWYRAPSWSCGCLRLQKGVNLALLGSALGVTAWAFKHFSFWLWSGCGILGAIYQNVICRQDNLMLKSKVVLYQRNEQTIHPGDEGTLQGRKDGFNRACPQIHSPIFFHVCLFFST